MVPLPRQPDCETPCILNLDEAYASKLVQVGSCSDATRPPTEGEELSSLEVVVVVPENKILLLSKRKLKVELVNLHLFFFAYCLYLRK